MKDIIIMKDCTIVIVTNPQDEKESWTTTKIDKKFKVEDPEKNDSLKSTMNT